MRVTITAADGTNVEIRIPGGYQPDVLDDIVARAGALLTLAATTVTPTT